MESKLIGLSSIKNKASFRTSFFNLTSFFSLIRPKQYAKNGFVFLPLIFSEYVTHPDLFFSSFLAFITFCLSASGVYIYNDIRDVEFDRLHPQKKQRPIAAGKITTRLAAIIAIILLIAGIAAAFYQHIFLGGIITTYILMNIAYSSGLKQIPILDIAIIAIGFVLRVLAGAVVIEVTASVWIILMTFLLAIFLGLGKRRDDMLLNEEGLKARKNVDSYNVLFLNIAMGVMASVVIVSYIMYTVSEEVITRVGSENLYLTVVFVILGILRYLQRTLVENNSGNPTEALYDDRFLQYCIAGWLVTIMIIFYY